MALSAIAQLYHSILFCAKQYEEFINLVLYVLVHQS